MKYQLLKILLKVFILDLFIYLLFILVLEGMFVDIN